MKKPVALLLVFALMLALCACGGGSYTAVPELKLSWDMSPEEVQKASPVKTIYSTREDGYSFVSSEPGQKLPRIAGVPLSLFACVFDRDRMIQVRVSIEYSETKKNTIVIYDYKTVVDLFTKEYGQPTSRNSGGSGPLSAESTVWVLDSRAIEIQGNTNIVQQIVFYANAAEEAAAPADPAEVKPEPTESAEPASEPAAGTIESESPEERFSRILREELKGKWISANNNLDELEIYESGEFFSNGEQYGTLVSMEEYEEGKDYYFSFEENHDRIEWVADDDVIIISSDLPGMESGEFSYFCRDGSVVPGEPFYGEWTLISGSGLTWDGKAVQEISVSPTGELVLDGRDIGLTLVLYPDQPDFLFYRWVINRRAEDGSYFGIFFEEKEPVFDPENTILVIDNLGRSVYRRK